MNWNDYINWSGGTDHYNIIINETTCGIDPRNSIRLNSSTTEYLLENIINSCTYEIVIIICRLL